MTRVAPHGTWESPISAATAAGAALRLGGVLVDGDDVYWLEGRPAEGGRTVLVRRGAGGEVTDVTPAGFNVRSRVHESGGGACAVSGGMVVFCNDADQRLWRQDPGAAPVPLTPAGRMRYADLVIDRRRGQVIAVGEDHAAPGEPVAALVSVPLGGGAAEVIASGADFYAAPRLAPDGARLAWLSWDHPRMPWDGTELWMADLDERGELGPATLVAGGAEESVLHPAFSPAGTLWFASDRSGWWNLHRLIDGRVEPAATVEAEFAAAPWALGFSTYAFVGDEAVACAFQREGTWRLGLLAAGRPLAPIASDLTEVAWVQGAPGRAVFAGGSPAEAMAIRALDAGTGALTTLHRPVPPAADEGLIALPRAVTFPTAGGAVAHGLFYAPRNPRFAAPDGERPPLIVFSHGGPTGAAQTALSFPLQFWTSRGFAVLDVNYRGSTGYGRAYRRALDGLWGVADVEDCVAGARHLAAQGLVDGGRLLIRGSSAGGYTTLAALTSTDAFRAGASLYGISDLEALAKDTHKFESRYLERLIGPYPARRDLYVARSPIHRADRLSCPVIFFQGLEDRVVPPDQAERMVAALRAKGMEAPYVAFPGEQHGFRRAENIARALEEELAFYRRVLGLAGG